jgi:ABC-type sugar transport systems, permease components
MRATGYLFILPAFAMWLLWFLIPALQSFALSFFKYNYAKPAGNRFVGLANYGRLFSDGNFFTAFLHSVIMVGIAVPLQTCFALLLSLCVNGKIRLRGFFRTVFYVPYVISSVAVATVFMYIFVANAPIPSFLSSFGLDNVTWATDMRYALALVIVMYVWQQVGFYMVIFLSGLQSISGEIYESASLDGAVGARRLWFITLPLLKPVTLLVSVYGLINAFQVYDQIATLSVGGQLGSPAGATSTLVTFFYLNSFKFGDVGYGSASAVVLFAIIFFLTFVQRKVVGDER